MSRCYYVAFVASVLLQLLLLPLTLNTSMLPLFWLQVGADCGAHAWPLRQLPQEPLERHAALQAAWHRQCHQRELQHLPVVVYPAAAARREPC
jgi:hypothetical protein